MKLTKLFLLIAVIGFASCKNTKTKEVTTAAKEAVTTTTTAPTSTESGKYTIDVANSNIMWTGTKLSGSSHNGTLKLSKGAITLTGGNITGGAFEIDMNSIANLDMSDAGKRSDLEGHLKNGDFFDVANHPTGIFTVSKIELLEKNVNNITHKVYGDLTLKGIAKPIEFNASVAILGDKISIVTPAFEINRTDWGVNFHSGILGTVKDKIIKDEIKLVLDIKASK